MILRLIWKLFNKDIPFEKIEQINITLRLAKYSLSILQKHKRDLLSGIEVGYRNDKIASNIQNVLTPFDGKDYRMAEYRDLEHGEETYNKLRDGLPNEISDLYLDFDFDISNKKLFLEDTFQILFLMWRYRNNNVHYLSYEILTKAARRCTYDLSHLGAMRVIDKSMIDGFYTKHYENLFTINGSILQAHEITRNKDFYFVQNNKLADEFTKLKIEMPEGVDIIPF